MKDIEENEDVQKTGSLYLAYEDTDPVPPPFIFVPDFSVIHTMILAAAT